LVKIRLKRKLWINKIKKKKSINSKLAIFFKCC
jgi:hypothetical protein